MPDRVLGEVQHFKVAKDLCASGFQPARVYKVQGALPRLEMIVSGDEMMVIRHLL